jgi:hypothetical protein
VTGDLDDFTRSYAEAALWDSTGGANTYGLEALAASTLRAMYDDCLRFQQLVTEAVVGDVLRVSGTQVAHDFWLTRCLRGTGFWDGRYAEPAASTLTRIAREFGEASLYVGDDGFIYQLGSENR